MNQKELAQSIRDKAIELGFEGCGIIKLDSLLEYEEKLDQRIAEVPMSRPMMEPLRRYASPNQIRSWAKSVLVCITRYGNYKTPDELEGLIGKYYLYDHPLRQGVKVNQSISDLESYVRGLGIKLYKEIHGVTSARLAASKAGLGIIRKNNFFYTENGSWYILDTWLMDHELEWIKTSDIESCPENCNKCIDACPTKALSKPYCTNFLTCVTGLTWGIRDVPPEALRKIMGNWVYGCDACQNACPMNQKVISKEEEYPGLDELAEKISLKQIMSMDEDMMEKLLYPKFWFIRKENSWIWKVNAIRAMTNAFQPEYEAYIRAEACNENDMIREMAEWSLEKLGFNKVEA